MIPTGNAKFALVIAENPPYHHVTNPKGEQWGSFLATIKQQLPPNAKIQKIHDNVWLIPLDTEMPFLCKLFEWTNGMSIPLRILFLDEEPAWIKYPLSSEKQNY